MKLLFVLLLFRCLALQKCQDTVYETDIEDTDIIEIDVHVHSSVSAGEGIFHSDVPVPSITVYQQVENRERVMVVCRFQIMSDNWSSFQLSVESEQNYTLEKTECFPNDVCVFEVTVSPPVSFTCLQKMLWSSEFVSNKTYTYVLKHHDKGVFSVYIGFVSFIILGLIIMTAAVILTTLKSNAKGPITTITDNDYVDV